VTALYPAQILLAMTAGMSIPVVAWMLVRGMGGRNAAEMEAAIVLPVLPFLGLVWLDVTGSAVCWGYRAMAVVAVLVLLGFCRGSYCPARYPAGSQIWLPGVAAGQGAAWSPPQVGWVCPLCSSAAAVVGNHRARTKLRPWSRATVY
jgi:hypothetical protein